LTRGSPIDLELHNNIKQPRWEPPLDYNEITPFTCTTPNEGKRRKSQETTNSKRAPKQERRRTRQASRRSLPDHFVKLQPRPQKRFQIDPPEASQMKISKVDPEVGLTTTNPTTIFTPINSHPTNPSSPPPLDLNNRNQILLTPTMLHQSNPLESAPTPVVNNKSLPNLFKNLSTDERDQNNVQSLKDNSVKNFSTSPGKQLNNNDGSVSIISQDSTTELTKSDKSQPASSSQSTNNCPSATKLANDEPLMKPARIFTVGTFLRRIASSTVMHLNPFTSKKTKQGSVSSTTREKESQ